MVGYHDPVGLGTQVDMCHCLLASSPISGKALHPTHPNTINHLPVPPLLFPSRPSVQ